MNFPVKKGEVAQSRRVTDYARQRCSVILSHRLSIYQKFKTDHRLMITPRFAGKGGTSLESKMPRVEFGGRGNGGFFTRIS